jgi:hypothetical protein
MKVYHGIRTEEGVKVTVDGQALKHVCLHSPDGFEWGYGGSGPADLALSILADLVGDDTARAFHQDFKWKFICLLPHDEWELGEAGIMEWLKQAKEADAEERENFG